MADPENQAQLEIYAGTNPFRPGTTDKCLSEKADVFPGVPAWLHVHFN